MLEMASVLLGSGILMIIAYEFNYMMNKREFGENPRSFF